MPNERWAWQSGPPYATPGSPPIGQELATRWPLTKQFAAVARETPYQIVDSLPYGAHGRYNDYTGTVELTEPINMSTVAHEDAHRLSRMNPFPFWKEFSPSWLLEAWKPTTPKPPAGTSAFQYPGEALAYAVQTYAPPLTPPPSLMPHMAQFFQYPGVPEPPAQRSITQMVKDLMSQFNRLGR